MPYKIYHGKTGVIYNVTKSSVGVILYKRVGNRYIEKRISARTEHVRPSGSRDDFLKRVKENAAKKKQAKEDGTKLLIKRVPKQPREAKMIDGPGTENRPESIAPVAYETTI